MLINVLHDAPISNTPLEHQAIGQLTILVLEAANVVPVALVGRVNGDLVVVEEGEVAMLVCDDLVGTVKAPESLDGLVDLGLKTIAVSICLGVRPCV